MLPDLEAVETGQAVWEKIKDAIYNSDLHFSIVLPLQRAYSRGLLTKPLDKLTDIELYSVHGIGVKRFAEIRRAFPYKETSDGKWRA